MTKDTIHAESEEQARVAERLLAWGFTAEVIARQLRCGSEWVEALQRKCERDGTDVDEGGRRVAVRASDPPPR